MRNFKEYCLSESKKDGTNKINCFMDLVESVRDVFKDYTLSTRKKAWKKFNSPKAKALFEQLLVNPNKSLNSFKSLDD